MPYLVPVDRVKAEEWVLQKGRPERIGDAPIAWDYHTALEFTRVLQVDLDGAMRDCFLGDGVQISLCVRSSTTNSRIRTLLVQQEVDVPGPVNLSVTIDGATLGGILALETTLELRSDASPTHPFGPRRAGSVLWRETVALPLEGDGGLLPIAPMSFAENLRLPNDAAWYVSLDFTDWSAAAMGCLLVLVNTDQATVSRALASTSDDPLACVLWDALAADIVSDVVARALDDESFPIDSAEQQSEVLTLAGLVFALVRSYLMRSSESPAEAIDRVRALRRSDPSMYRAEVQRGIHFLKEMS